MSSITLIGREGAFGIHGALGRRLSFTRAMVQIASKSMLLNTMTARRIVDDCISPKQRELIEAAKAAKAASGAS